MKKNYSTERKGASNVCNVTRSFIMLNRFFPFEEKSSRGGRTVSLGYCDAAHAPLCCPQGRHLHKRSQEEGGGPGNKRHVVPPPALTWMPSVLLRKQGPEVCLERGERDENKKGSTQTSPSPTHCSLFCPSFHRFLGGATLSPPPTPPRTPSPPGNLFARQPISAASRTLSLGIRTCAHTLFAGRCCSPPQPPWCWPTWRTRGGRGRP